jgi:hypothetical protein
MLQQTTPYFYIIKNKHTGLRYAGSKWAQGCHPAEFMTENGYCTSSNTIAEIIKSDGLDAFQVETIVTEFNGLSTYDYETAFLVENDCAASPDWYNCHNNMGFDFGSAGFKKHMLAKHGVEHAMHSEEIKDKLKQTNLDRRGVENPMQDEDVKSKAKITNLGKFGCEHVAQNEEVQAKTKATNLDRHGVECSFQREEVKAKSKITNLDRRGVENPMQSEEVKAKSKITNIDRYGASSYCQSEAYRNTFYTCKYCDMKSNSSSNMNRYHNDNCKHKPKDDSVV